MIKPSDICPEFPNWTRQTADCQNMPSHVYVLHKLKLLWAEFSGTIFGKQTSVTNYSPFCWSWSPREMQSNLEQNVPRYTKTALAEWNDMWELETNLWSPGYCGVTCHGRVTWKSRTTESMVSHFPDFPQVIVWPLKFTNALHVVWTLILLSLAVRAVRVEPARVCVCAVSRLRPVLTDHARSCMYSLERQTVSSFEYRCFWWKLRNGCGVNVTIIYPKFSQDGLEEWRNQGKQLYKRR